jgi:tetratricopeptide (TPR) repeat protein
MSTGQRTYRAAIRIDPKLAGALCNLGNLLVNKHEDIDGAEGAYRAAIAADPQHAHAHGALGQLCLNQRGAFAEAAALLRRSIELAPHSPHVTHAQVGLGVALVQQGNLEGAEAAWRHALAIDPENANALVNLRLLCQGPGRSGAGPSPAALRHATTPSKQGALLCESAAEEAAAQRRIEEEEKEALAQQAMMELLMLEEEDGGGGGGGGGAGKKRGGKGKKKRK